jgi:hypothetical protein
VLERGVLRERTPRRCSLKSVNTLFGIPGHSTKSKTLVFRVRSHNDLSGRHPLLRNYPLTGNTCHLRAHCRFRETDHDAFMGAIERGRTSSCPRLFPLAMLDRHQQPLIPPIAAVAVIEELRRPGRGR